jgi:hypothetical protein
MRTDVAADSTSDLGQKTRPPTPTRLGADAALTTATAAVEADYVARSQGPLSDVKMAVEMASTVFDTLHEERKRYQEAIQILLAGMKGMLYLRALWLLRMFRYAV